MNIEMCEVFETQAKKASAGGKRLQEMHMHNLYQYLLSQTQFKTCLF